MNNKEDTQVKWAPESWFTKNLQSNSEVSYYNHYSNGYQNFRHLNQIGIINKNIEKLNNKNILDIGCGTGVFTELIRKDHQPSEIYGLDFISDAIQVAKLNFNEINFFVSKLPEINIQKKKFDFIIASEVIYYLNDNAQKILINNIYNLLNKDGIIFITSAIGDNYLNEKKIIGLFEKNFKVISKNFLHMYLYNNFILLFNYSIRLKELIDLNIEPNSQEMTVRYKKYLKFTKLPFFYYLLKLLNFISKPIVKSIILPRIFNFFGLFTNPTNIIILAKKK